jgi:hypothetical protein
MLDAFDPEGYPHVVEPPTIGVNRIAALLPPNVTHVRARLDRCLTA